MTAGPTPVPPARLAGDGRADALPPRARVRRALRARARARCPTVFQTANDVLTFAASGSGAMESAVANLVRPGTKVLACAAGKFGERWIELGEAYGAELVALRAGLGRAPRPGRDRPPARRERRHRGRLRHAVSETSTGIVHDVQAIAEVVRAPRRDPRRRRRLRPRRRRAAPGRVGRRRRRRRLAEGADVPARPRASRRVSQRALDFAARAARRPLLLRLGQDRQEPAQGPPTPVHARRAAVPRRSTSRST